MIGRRIVSIAAGLVMLPLAGSVAHADETGLAGMHSWVKVGRKTCMSSHFHYGNSSGQRSKKAAMQAAVQDWASFTATEYGTSWARFSIAGSRSVKCGQTSSGWSCAVEARPCRPF